MKANMTQVKTAFAARRRIQYGGFGLVLSATVTLALLLSGSSACDSDSASASPPGTTPSNGDSGPPSTDGGTDSAPAPSCTLERVSTASGKVLDLGTPAPFAGVPDVKVCLFNHPELPCVMTGPDGTYEHTCVPEGDVSMLFSKTGFAQTLWLRVFLAGVGQNFQVALVPDAVNKKLFETAGETYPRPGYGLVTLNDQLDTSGITVAPLSPGASGPFYSAHGIDIDRDAGGTIGEGLVFMIAPVGSLTFQMTAPALSDGGTSSSMCQQALGGWGAANGKMTVPVLENTETSLNILCP